MNIGSLNHSVSLAIIFSGIFLWVGMLTGVWKYYQIRHSEQARAHYYVDIAHRSSLLYAPASLILAVLAYFSIWDEGLNLIFVLINLFFFSFSILSYILHGWLQDTSNQFKQPHQMGRWHLPKWMLSSVMILLVIGELGATAGLLLGTIMGLNGF
ncbi:hypothetical protein [Acinetobacter sp.]|uniref:hypothetical protein n=1 Tax=Acinetobacter sp. TaxID=472 RepID=UPI00388F5266